MSASVAPELAADEWDFLVACAGDVPQGRLRFLTLSEEEPYDEDDETPAYGLTTHGDATTRYDAEQSARDYHEQGAAFVYLVGRREGEAELWQWLAEPERWPAGRLVTVKRRELAVDRRPRRRLSGLASAAG